MSKVKFIHNVLIYPMLSVDVINSDSNYVLIKNICNEILKNHDDINFILLLDKNRKYFKDDLDKRIKVIAIPMEKSKRRQVINLNTKIFDKLYKMYPINVVWNNVTEQGCNIRNLVDQLDLNYKMKVINYHHYNIHPSFGEAIYKSMKNILYQQMVGSLDVNVNYFHSQHSFNMFSEEAEKFLHKNKYEEVRKNCVVKLGGYVNKDMFENTNKYDKYTFIYNHRLAGYKNWKTTFALFDKLDKELNGQFQVIYTGGDVDNEKQMRIRKYVQIKHYNNHTEYLKELAKCHANVTNSSHETYCISIAESIFAGHYIIAPKAVTFPELLGVNYEGLYVDVEQQYELMKQAVIDNKTGQHGDVSDKSIQNHAQWFYELIKKQSYKPVFVNMKQDKAKALVKKYFTKNSYKLAEASKIVFSELNYATQSFPYLKIDVLMQDLGYEFDLARDSYIRK